MKIIDVPQTGKCGLTVTFPSRNGLIRRAWVVPSNPQSAEQLVVRGRLASMAAAYDALTRRSRNQEFVVKLGDERESQCLD